MSNLLYKIKNLEVKSDDHTVILDKINLNINKGENLGLIGETGSGKSMLGSTLMDMVPMGCSITSGFVKHYFDSDKSISTLRGINLSKISQNPMQALNPLQTIEKQFFIILNKRYGYKKNKIKRQITYWVEKVHLHEIPNILERYPHQLSGGQMQRVMIAMAMSVEPEFIIADEITTGLDTNIKMEILNLMFSFQKQFQFSVLLISHDLNTVIKYCDKIAIIQSGKIIDVGKTEMIIDSNNDRYVKTFTDNFKKSLNEIPTKINKQESDAVLYINNINKSYNSKVNAVPTLKGISFDINKGETIGVIGESGSGKTTLAKTILNLLERDSGDIDILKNGKRISLTKPTRDIGVVFQDSQGSLNPRMRVYDILCEPLFLNGVKDQWIMKEKIIEELDKVNLDHSLLKSFPHELSGGQRQRVSIIRSLLVNPSILILDEPTSALDTITQEKILILLKDIQIQKNLSYIFISHDLGVVSEVSDRIMVLYKGEIVEFGNTNNVLINPSNDYTKKLIDSNSWMGKN